VDTPGDALGVAVSGTHAYVADGSSGLQVIDIANPQNPQIVGSVNAPDAAMGVAVSGTHAYVAAYGSGLQVIDISDPFSPQVVGSVDTPGDALWVAVSGTHVYVADGSSGLQVLQAQCDPSSGIGEDGLGASEMLLRAYPNPGSGQTLIQFETRNSGVVQASVYDLAGRRVRRLSDGILCAGGHWLSWNGLDDSGRPLPSGVYLARITTSEGTRTARVVVAK
jgi:hypothetical protein